MLARMQRKGNPPTLLVGINLVYSFIHSFIHLFIFKILFIYLTERDHKQAERQAEREEEAGSLLSREPDAGLDPRTLGS